MNPFKSDQKLFIEVCDEPSEMTLEEMLAGASGTMRLGKKGVHLWVPGDNPAPEDELVFDIRLRPLSAHDFDIFKKACKGRFMTSYIALMTSTDPERIKALLEYFNYVLVPNKNIKNTPADFRNRVLSYRNNKS